MQKPSFDPGLTQQVTGALRRAINKDGSFNVERRGTSWRDIHPYLHLINTSWPAFLAIVCAAYLFVNTVFAFIYFNLGPGEVQGTNSPTPFLRFLNDFFFSAHTLTTVGYGNYAPIGVEANSVAAFEAMVGLMGFALEPGRKRESHQSDHRFKQCCSVRSDGRTDGIRACDRAPFRPCLQTLRSHRIQRTGPHRPLPGHIESPIPDCESSP